MENFERYMREAEKIAKLSSCLRTKCGSVVVKNGEIIGRGFNSPPGNSESQRRCTENKKEYHSKVTDKTCCVHAEQRAILDALKNSPSKIKGSDLFFIRLSKEDAIEFAGKPYCTVCSKMALDTGIKNFVLWHKEGIKSYSTEEYNKLSYEFDED